MQKKSFGNEPKIKQRGIKRFVKSFRYSWQGLKYAYLNEQSLSIHVFITLLVVIGGIYFQISQTQWLFALMFIGLVMATELINTAIEATIDLVSPEYHELAKIAKDTASAAVGVFSLVALIGGLTIFLPEILNLL